LRSKFPISHQVNLVGEVHGHRQLDEQVNAEAVAALRDDWASCKPTAKADTSYNHSQGGKVMAVLK